MKRTMRDSTSTCASFQMPRSCGLMRPSGVTAVASVNTSPAPPTARLPRWTRCQSFANPSSLEYSHIGETKMRLLNVMPRIDSGSRRRAIECIVCAFCGLEQLAVVGVVNRDRGDEAFPVLNGAPHRGGQFARVGRPQRLDATRLGHPDVVDAPEVHAIRFEFAILLRQLDQRVAPV